MTGGDGEQLPSGSTDIAERPTPKLHQRNERDRRTRSPLAVGTRLVLIVVGLLVVAAAWFPLRNIGDTMDSPASTYLGAAATFVVVGGAIVVAAVRVKRPWVVAAAVSGIGGLLLTGDDVTVTSAAPAVIGTLLAAGLLFLEWREQRPSGSPRPDR